jgi:hypothetical protein
MDPLFIDPVNNDFRLQQNSPCIGTGRYGEDRGALPFGSTSIDNETMRPFSYITSKNYPNPFNVSTTIAYNLPERAFVNLEIYDILGRRIDVIINGEQEKGSHQVNWNAADLNSGVYFYKLNVGGVIQSGKMVFLK